MPHNAILIVTVAHLTIECSDWWVKVKVTVAIFKKKMSSFWRFYLWTDFDNCEV